MDRGGTTWTAEQDETLARMLREGHSYGIISDHVGKSRNACIGRAKRRDLPAYGQGEGRAMRRRQAPIRKSSRPKPSTPRVATEIPEAAAPAEATVPPAAVSAPETGVFYPERVGLLELRRDACRYPYGDRAPFEFCGRKAEAGLSYCEAHARACYSRMPDRKEGPAAKQLRMAAIRRAKAAKDLKAAE